MMARRSYAGIIKSSFIAAGVLGFAASAHADEYTTGMQQFTGGPGTELELSANVALTTDYVFRGISQTLQDPAVSGGFDASYGIFYLGTWASNVDFGGTDDVEIDYYGGVAPTWAGIDFDFSILAYTYPGGDTDTIWEGMFAMSKSFMDDKLSLGWANYFELENGDYWVPELSAGYTFDKVSIFTPTLSGVIGWVDYDTDASSYTYWNVGMSLGFYKDDMFTLDLRYWDSDLSAAGCGGDIDLCDERVVGTLSASF
ncbi:TorF family putative porin [Methyloligella sp. 2.7D]|uniref:TorF family putative porin n=1 Tax=unclassified Methyloligella TaxID=2625955 RepID=UPI001ABB7AB8|nr:TorF family putative porin [Methyloligella sp. GL2]